MSILFLIASVGFSFVAWGIVVAWYVWPQLRGRSRAEAIGHCSFCIAFVSSAYRF